MSKKRITILVILCISLFIIRCKPDKSPVPYEPEPIGDTTGIFIDMHRIPYPKLSDYRFFTGELKAQVPAKGVLPYQLASSLFTDYALKNRFVWMPSGKKALYDGDGKSLDFPVGSVLIKNFYYDGVQPANNTRIIETRLMIKKREGWIFAEYVWNDEQTEAVLDMNGSNTDISWKNEHGEMLQTNYRIPSETECLTCHKESEIPVPIGTKPQNLNNNLTYTDGSFNQLQKWIKVGYLESAGLPAVIESTVDYRDESKPLGLRVRSYLDISCGHCHQEASHCDYRPIRLAFSETDDLTNMGVCVAPDEQIDGNLKYIIMPQRPDASVMYYRMNTTDVSTRMPLLGRNIVHIEGVALMKEWINSLGPCN